MAAQIKGNSCGTVISEGRVYDNIIFHNRGQASTFVSGKNKWGFKFDRGHDLDARDTWGRKFAHGWDSMPMNACASPWVQSNRGMAGLDRSGFFPLYELAGDPSPRVRHVQFRIIDRSDEEAPAKNQYQGDRGASISEGSKIPMADFLRRDISRRGMFIASPETMVIASTRRPISRPTLLDWNSFRDDSHKDQSEAWWRRTSRFAGVLRVSRHQSPERKCRSARRRQPLLLPSSRWALDGHPMGIST